MFVLLAPFTIFVEYRMRFGIVKPKMKFSFASALSFHYLCKYEDKLRFGIGKSEM